VKIAVFSAKPYDEAFLEQANQAFGHELHYFESRLSEKNMMLAAGFEAICVFTNDKLNRVVLKYLASHGIRLVALRCAGYNNIDLDAAREFKIQIVRVPTYSPNAVAEHAVALMLCLNRKLHRAYSRVRECNFTLDGLIGFDMHGKTVGIIGLGKIGAALADIVGKGFGCRVLAYDPSPNLTYEEHGVHYTSLETLLKNADIISLHCPLTTQTCHMIDDAAIALMKPEVMLINTSRGEVMDTQALIRGLKSGKIGSLGLDVYEEETDIFFEDFSQTGVQDETCARLLTFPNVMLTCHQGFFTQEALATIANTTLKNIAAVEHGTTCPNQVPTPA